MKAIIEIDMSGAAFEPGDNNPIQRYTAASRELRSILDEACRRIEGHRLGPGDTWKLLDANGNTCGTFRIEE